jgi:hypothetical protein
MPCLPLICPSLLSRSRLIAIMLGRLRMSTEEALREYDTCAEKIFSSRNKKWYVSLALPVAHFQLS